MPVQVEAGAVHDLDQPKLVKTKQLMLTIKTPRTLNLLPFLFLMLSMTSEKIIIWRFLLGNPKNTSLRYSPVLSTILSSLPRVECEMRRQGGTHLCPGRKNLPAIFEACCLEQHLSCWPRCFQQRPLHYLGYP